MALYDQFQWAPGMGMDSVSTNTLRQSQADQVAAATQETKVDTAQKQAELQEFISQTAKDLRETERTAKIGKFQEEIAQSEALKNFYANNPGMRDQQIAQKNHAEMTKLSKEITDDEADMEHTFVSKWYDPVSGRVNTDNYLTERDAMIKSGAFKEDELPTAQDIASNPEALTVLSSAAAYSFNTQEQKAAKAAAAQLAKDKLKEQGQQDASQMARLKEELRVKVDEGKLDRESRERIQGRHDDVKIQAAELKKAAEKSGKAMPPERFGLIMDQRYKAAESFDIMADQLDLNLDEDEATLAKNKIWAAAMSEYATQAKLFEKGERSDHPAGPEDLAILMTRKAFSNPKGWKAGLEVFNTGEARIDRPDTTNEPQSKVEKPKTGAETLKQEAAFTEYKSHALNKPKEGSGMWVDPEYKKKIDAWTKRSDQMLKDAGYNSKQIAMMQDDGFISATKAEQEEMLKFLK